MFPRKSFILTALLAAPAFAQTAPAKSFDIEQLQLTSGGERSLVLSAGDTLEKGRLRLSLAAQYQRDPLVYELGGERVGAVIGSRVSSHLAAAYGVTDAIELGVQLPVVLAQSGDDLSSHGIDAVSSTVVGAPMLHGHFSLLRQSSGAPVDVGVAASLTLPLGSSTGFARDPGPGVSFMPRVGVAHAFEYFRLAGEVGAVLRDRDTLSRFSNDVQDEVGSLLTFGVSAATLGDGLRGEVTLRSLVPLTRTAAAFELLAGARYPLPRNLEAFAMVGPGFGQMPGNPVFRVFAGVAWTPSMGSSAQVAPLAVEEPAPAPVETKVVETVAEVAPVEVAPVVVEEQDPSTALGANDSDSDGVPDSQDNCPDVAGDAEHQGCAQVVLQADRISIKDSIRFATGKAEVLQDSMTVLEQVASVLKAHPELTKLEISGHTDDRGQRAYNVALSQSRADEVRRILIEKGIAPERLEAKGFGPDRPIAPNADEAGREQNRRVEFTSLQ